MTLNPNEIRSQFPALVRNPTTIFFDNPAGTQVPQGVIDAYGEYYSRMNANSGGYFQTSRATDEMTHDVRQEMAYFLNANDPHEIVFGANMTTLNFALSRALAQTLRPGDEIVLTRMDHDANVAPWLLIARDHGLTVRWVDILEDDCTLDLNSLEAALTDRTKIVATVHASNAVGTVNPVARIAEMAHAANALYVVDAVQSAPHVPIDVQKIGCDFLLCSAYKFFGPHIGIMWGKYDLLQSLPAYKVRPSKDVTPFRWENGTPSFETIAGTAEAVRYLESLRGDNPPMIEGYGGRQLHLKQAFRTMQSYEMQLAEKLLTGLQAIRGVTIAGITDTNKLQDRVATVAFVKDGHTPEAIAEHLAQQEIFVWAGDYYALELMNRLGREDKGMVRVGAVHYNTMEEIDTFLNAVDSL